MTAVRPYVAVTTSSFVAVGVAASLSAARCATAHLLISRFRAHAKCAYHQRIIDISPDHIIEALLRHRMR